jgi:hypothetical protein
MPYKAFKIQQKFLILGSKFWNDLSPACLSSLPYHHPKHGLYSNRIAILKLLSTSTFLCLHGFAHAVLSVSFST